MEASKHTHKYTYRDVGTNVNNSKS